MTAEPTEDHIRRMLRAVAGNAVDAARLLRGRQHRAPADDDTCDAVLALLLGVQAEDPQCFLLATPQLLKDAPTNGVATAALAAFEKALTPEPDSDKPRVPRREPREWDKPRPRDGVGGTVSVTATPTLITNEAVA